MAYGNYRFGPIQNWEASSCGNNKKLPCGDDFFSNNYSTNHLVYVIGSTVAHYRKGAVGVINGDNRKGGVGVMNGDSQGSYPHHAIASDITYPKPSPTMLLNSNIVILE
jgi:hypothetical protein